jgi:hypothetical protein
MDDSIMEKHMNQEMMLKAGEKSVEFIDSMRPHELGIYTLRKAFEVGYLYGAAEILKQKETKENE